MRQDIATTVTEFKPVPVLTQQEEYDLFRKYETGDKRARNTLIEHNIRFVAKIAREYIGSKMSLDDLIGEGTLGLIAAIDKFDYKKGFRFTTFAAFGIRQAIITALRKQSNLVRLPQRKCKLVGEINRIRQIFVTKFGRQPSVEDLAELLSQTPEELTNVLNSCEVTLSFNSDDEESSFTLENIPDTSSLSSLEQCQNEGKKALIDKILKSLPKREEKLIRARFGLNADEEEVSLRAIGKEIGVSQEGARRIEHRVLAKLNKAAYQLKLSELR